ncbi:acetolactate synthase 2 small subunit, partial [Pectobacterium brasiliense]|uniref:acetolactate synthase 2 small subunit n=1 Tax=Pectobacterium brasiliense TaxID=180957 RepID=UPI001969A19E
THHQLSIQARVRPEVLERVLRFTLHRVFNFCGMNIVQTTNAVHINIELSVASHRSLDLLSSQLIKLLDIDCVDIQPMTTSQQISA